MKDETRRDIDGVADRVEEIFFAALQVTGEERSRVVNVGCAGDETLRQEVNSLLVAHDRAGRFIEPATGGPLSAVTASSGPRSGTRVGPFQLLDVLGEGGMGTVFRAERADGAFSQQVAIKFIASWIRNPAAAQRFRAERQILASLQHPNIVTLIDGGVTPEGEAYLVMEYVHGQSITTYCQARQLTLEDRLRLFATVCAAVHFAHAHLIVHRDLKPANIIVTSDGLVKVLDFGVAKLLEPSAGPAPTVTAFWPGPLTPNYASPEQLRGLPITTVSDVYALGVLLYELLTGSRPYETSGKPVDEVLAIVVDTVVPPASAPRHDIVLPYPASALAGDLDAIVSKALQKDPARRYTSAADLADDIGRYLDGRAVLAQPDRAPYRIRKFVGRHRVAVAAAGAAVLSLVIGLALALWQADTARAERDRARLETAKAQQVSAFLRALFTSNNPLESLGRTLTGPELLDRGVQRIDRELSGQPDVQASMLASLGSVYTEIGLGDRALPLIERSLAMREQIFGSEHVEVAESLHFLGRLKNRRYAEYPAAEQLLKRAITILDQQVGRENPLLAPVLSELGITLWRAGKYPEGQSVLRRAVRLGEQSAAADLHKWTANLALLEQELGDFETAESLMRRALELGVKEEGRTGVPIAVTMLNLGTLLRAQEELEEARALLEEVNADEEKTWGTGRLYTVGELGDLYFAMGDHRRARDFLDRAIAIGESDSSRPEQSDLAAPLTYSGRLFLAEGRPAEALAPLERALRIRLRTLGEKHNSTAETLVEIARAKGALEGSAAAEPLLRRALGIQRETLAADHRYLIPTLVTLGEVVLARGDTDQALKLFSEAREIARRRLPEHHSQRRLAEAAANRGSK